MFNGNDRIGCTVEWSALRDRAFADGTDPNDVAGTFKKHRGTPARRRGVILDDLTKATKKTPKEVGNPSDCGGSSGAETF